ncbi:hypothetical protein [Photobacterium ganghwense]|uniref:hypothetical protein n=1 Tax=Photobacterium ganghwense TaxID=320778 RepID=UPI001A8FDDA3|nr:hypothetical protein [Photobacterium ganghwense]QSV17153.1 hypothetical protein FH974_19640 [Photobacterium ganghwense]
MADLNNLSISADDLDALEKTSADKNACDIDDLDMLLGELDMPEVEEQKIEEPVAAADNEDDSLSYLDKMLDELNESSKDIGKLSDGELAAQLAKEAQHQQDVEAVASKQDDEFVEGEAKPKPKPKPKRKRVATGGKTAEEYVADKSDAAFEAVGIAKEEFALMLNALPKKVKDKAKNILAWANDEAELSIYTRLCLEYLVKNGSATSGDLRTYLMSNPEKPYTVGTAGSQAGQMMALLPAIGMATKDGKSITLNRENPLSAKFIG